MTLTTRQEEIKAEFIDVLGFWGDAWESILELDPEFLKVYLDFAAVPYREAHLDSKTREFMHIVVAANALHMYEPGVRAHIRAALAAGATREEIMEVLECAATVGIHSMNVGVPVLVEVLEEAGLRDGPAPLDETQEQIKADFTKGRGYWNSTWDEMLELTPEAFRTYTDFSSHPWRTGTLSPLTREFIYIAFDTAATHLYVKGLKLHIENALGYGGTPQQILEVMEIAAGLGMHGVALAAPILLEEAAAAK
ncbi:MAG TPA: carboxymuconolactone decarboxylase family protein [Candidatus Limnocylindrales bacterium]|nr:carboxymuconolactone decarboxylase family protein [Candidatus Limnocylindrales bacterium]